MESTMKTIFLVDDDVTNLKLGSSVLDKLYNVITLNSGTRLLKMLMSASGASNLPDLILLDVDMPEIDGYETISRIKEIDALCEIPVIFLTAKNSVENELEGLSRGAVDYITKPFSSTLLLKRIEMHLESTKQKKELAEFNIKLQKMVNEETSKVIGLQDAVIQTITDLIDHHDNADDSIVNKTQTFVRNLSECLQKSGYNRDVLYRKYI